ncbi:MAG: hypothetical protein AABX96_04425 [Nanoarchaeota archaeon]
MNLEEKLKPLKELVGDLKIADFFVVDTSASGIYFLTDGRELDLNFNQAKHNNVNSSRIKDSLKSAETFLDFLRNYDNVGATHIVLKEMETKKRNIEGFTKIYARAKRVYRSGNGFQSTSPVEKEISWLRKIIEKETEIIELLKSRVEEPDKDLKYIENLVMRTATWSADYDPNNLNDERIVAACIYRAFVNNKHVSIITRDHRFPKIISKTQLLFYNGKGIYYKLYNFLKKGNLSVILGEKGQGFSVDYCSEEFKPENFMK